MEKNLPINIRFARTRMRLALLTTDMICILLSWWFAFMLWSLVKPQLDKPFYYSLAPGVFFFILVYSISGLYGIIGISPIDELRRLTTATSFVFLSLTALSFWLRNAEDFSRATLTISWINALLLVPLGRSAMRKLATRLKLWGEPIVIFGFGPNGRKIYRFLEKNPRAGLRPVLAVGNGPCHPEDYLNNIICLSISEVLEGKQDELIQSVNTAIIIPSEAPTEILYDIVTTRHLKYSHIITVSGNPVGGSVWVTPYDLGGILGMEVLQNLLSPTQKLYKTILDWVLILGSSIAWAPLLGLCVLLIRLDSRGNAFFYHTRIGQNRKPIKVLKLRTMVQNADQILKEYLDTNPEYKKEWETHQKLKHDPRITKVGRFLRKFSIDELPQFINILRGEMSLVGPRPITQSETIFYDDRLDLVLNAKPGVTGFWQVSGRSELTYEDRVDMDEYYVRNWSIWFDLYIIARTFMVVLGGKGAY